MNLLIICLTFLVKASLGLADGDGDGDGFDHNPILALQPQFARSLPVQILLIGIVFTLTAVLLFHLIFTAQYHWALAPVNYGLQLSGVLTLFISLIATIQVILSKTMADSQQWPYMLNYLAIDIPNFTSDDNSTAWSMAELSAWYIMDATTSALVQITHIQFLTLLFPSQLETRLIMFLLGPLALLSAAMEVLPVQQNQKVLDIADTLRNTCNAALSLLFTVALVIWGFFVNRKNAWRTDGGTAAFGCGAIILAFISTALNFLYIPSKDDYSWLPRLIWAVVLWQSFLGWWWWVGGGMGIRDVEEMIRLQERKERKRKARALKNSERKEKAQAFWRNASQSLRLTKTTQASSVDGPVESIELSDRSGSAAAPPASGGASDSSSASGVSPRSMRQQVESTFIVRTFRRWYYALRQEHIAAVHVQAADGLARRAQVFGASGTALEGERGVYGWGLGSFGLRERERREALQNDLEEDQEVMVMTDPDRGTDSARELRAAARSRSEASAQSWSLWWWGPLRRWRLQDSTAY